MTAAFDRWKDTMFLVRVFLDNISCVSFRAILNYVYEKTRDAFCFELFHFQLELEAERCVSAFHGVSLLGVS